MVQSNQVPESALARFLPCRYGSGMLMSSTSKKINQKVVKPKPTALSLFAGAGGMDLGVEQAGFNVVGSIEVDPNACATLRNNRGPETVVIEADIRTINPRRLLKQLDLDEGLDLLFGGPPCQTFSQIGKQAGVNDVRGMLLFEMVRFAKILRPKVVMIENVKGLISAKGPKGERGEVLSMLLLELTKVGYRCRFAVLNAADYGVPQNRRRVFIVATEKTLPELDFPHQTHSESETVGLFSTQLPHVTVGDVIGGLPFPGRRTDKEVVPNHIDVTPPGDVRRIIGVGEGSHLARELHLPLSQRGKLSRKDTTKFLRTSRFRPSNTLRCGEIFYHPLENRYLTPREYLRIHGYPDTYILSGPIRSRTGVVRELDQHRLVANSVPPPLAKAVANQIYQLLSSL